MDVFIEKIVARRKTGTDRLITAGLIAAAIIIMFVTSTIQVLTPFGIFIAAGLIYGVYYLTTSKNIEYEYAITNGEIDIDMIIARRKRKRVYSGSSKEFEIVARKNSPHYTPQIANIANKVTAVSSMEAEDIYFIVGTYKGARTLVLFQPDQRMLASFKTFNPRKIFE